MESFSIPRAFEDNFYPDFEQLLLTMGVIQVKGNFSYVVNTDYHEKLSELYQNFCSGKIEKNTLLEQAILFQLPRVIS